VWPPGSADTVCPRPSVTLTFDRLTLKLVCESHLTWGTFLPNFGTLGLWVLELFAMYATDGQTDGRTDKSNAYCPLPYGRGIIKGKKYMHCTISTSSTKTSQQFNVLAQLTIFRSNVAVTQRLILDLLSQPDTHAKLQSLLFSNK